MFATHTKKSILINIFWLYTLITYTWVVAEFFTKGDIAIPISVSAVYLIALSVYVGDKEIRRRLKNHTHPLRKGEYYVYLWGATFIITSIFVISGGNTSGFVVPTDMTVNAGIVIMFYFITDFLKEKCNRKTDPDCVD